ncbi:MAG: 4-alpha-glucanotransferase [Candidatus Brocadiia bacterium]|nr:MAG: 4-alpha-glucanotransferase [Candidatus Brocadiia bacterium]
MCYDIPERFDIMNTRSSGILLHITSLPSKFGIGDFGPAAYEFADFLRGTGQSYWQVLPLNPPASEITQSPYDCVSAFAGNPLLISPALLAKQGLLTAGEIKGYPAFSEDHVNFRKAIPYKTKLLNTAFERFKAKPDKADFRKFCSENSHWLDNYANFASLRNHFRTGNWPAWPDEFGNINKIKSASFQPKPLNSIEKEKFLQYEFHRQWQQLKTYCGKLGIKLIGDIPIYVSYQSADVWANPQFFKLNKAKRPQFVSGTPPDAFSKTGQMWNNPIYDWQMLKKTGYQWWLERIKHNLKLFDVVRIDHFRGFVAYWQIPANHKTAVGGRWVRVPGEHFFRTLTEAVPEIPFIAEDLGYITPAVKKLINKYHFPCMRILQFGFTRNPSKNAHYIKNHIQNCVVYPGTHDNNTIKAWFKDEISPLQKKMVFQCIGQNVNKDSIHRELVRLTMASPANLAVIPMQDILGLGAEARMNTPGTRAKANWTWRLESSLITSAIKAALKKLTKETGRFP